MTQDQDARKFADIHITFRNRQEDAVFFEDILGYQVGGGAVGVTQRNGQTVVYPLDTVAKVVHTVKEQE